MYSDLNVSIHLLLENCHFSLVDTASTSTISPVQYYPNHASPNLDWFDFDTSEVSENSIDPFQSSKIYDNGTQLKSNGSPSPCKSSGKHNTNKIPARSREINDLSLNPSPTNEICVSNLQGPRYEPAIEPELPKTRLQSTFKAKDINGDNILSTSGQVNKKSKATIIQ